MKRTPESNNNNSNEKNRPEKTELHFFLERTLASAAILSLFASLGATYEKNISKNNSDTINQRTIAEEIIDLPLDTSIGQELSAGMFDIIPGKSQFKLPGLEKNTSLTFPDFSDRSSIENSKTIDVDVQLMEWAKEFSADPKAIEPRGPEAIQNVVLKINDLTDNGWTINEITAKGFASDEPTIGTKDPANNELSYTRANAVKNILIGQLESNFINNNNDQLKNIEDSISVIDGEEIIDTELNSNIEIIAESLDLTTEDLIYQYNTAPDSLPDSAKSILQNLKDDRYVQIEIKASKQGEHAFGTNTIESSAVIIPIIIPIFRLRKRDKYNSAYPKREPTNKKDPHTNNNVYGTSHIGMASTGNFSTSKSGFQNMPIAKLVQTSNNIGVVANNQNLNTSQILSSAKALNANEYMVNKISENKIDGTKPNEYLKKYNYNQNQIKESQFSANINYKIKQPNTSNFNTISGTRINSTKRGHKH